MWRSGAGSWIFTWDEDGEKLGSVLGETKLLKLFKCFANR